MSETGDVGEAGGEAGSARRGRPRKPLEEIPGPLRGFARELRELAGDQSNTELTAALHWSDGHLSRALSPQKLPHLSVVTDLARYRGADEKEWKLRWARTHRRLEKAGSIDLLPKRHDIPEREALKEAAAEAEALLGTIDVTAATSRPYDSMRADQLLAGVDKDLPTRTSKVGGNAEECWVDLTDYLRRLVLLFDPRPIPTKSDGHAHLSDVLPRLAGLAELTSLPQWRDLADQIRSTYKKAQKTGWGAVSSTPSTVVVTYGDEFGGYRAAAGRKASQLARASAAYISDHPALEPAAPVDRRRYDPPRGDYIASAVAMAVLAVVVALVLWLLGTPATLWGPTALTLLSTALILVIFGRFRDPWD